MNGTVFMALETSSLLLSFSDFYSTDFTTSVTRYLKLHTMGVYATEMFRVSGLEWCLKTQFRTCTHATWALAAKIGDEGSNDGTTRLERANIGQ